MSAYTDGRPTPVISLISATQQFDQGPAALSDQFAGFASALKSLETTLAQERAVNRKLKEDWTRSQNELFAQIKDSQAKIRELQYAGNRLHGTIQENQRVEADLRTKLKSVESELAGVRDELNRYRGAWSGVLQREREAKMMISDSQQLRKTMEEVDKMNRSLQDAVAHEREARVRLERVGKHRDLELDNARARLQVLEGRTTDSDKIHEERLRKLRDSLEERLAQGRRECAELRKVLEAVRLERASENQRFARKIGEERKDREQTEAQMRRELGEMEAERDRAQARIVFLEKRQSIFRKRVGCLLAKIRLRLRLARKRLKAAALVCEEERARNEAMSAFVLQQTMVNGEIQDI